MLLHSVGEANLLPPSSVLPSFRPLPPLPSASTLQLPSFLNLSTRSFGSVADLSPHRLTVSLPASAALFPVSSSPVPSSRHAVVRETNNNKVFGPQWIPAFHHPNSPYVPWSSPVRRRILPPPSPVLPSSPFTRSGAVAPEPWASSTFSDTQNKSPRERLSSSWKSLKNSIKKGVKTVVSRLGKSRVSLRTLCTSHDMLRTYDDTNTTCAAQPPMTSHAMRSTPGEAHSSGPGDSLASFVSSDSKTLAAWITQRRATETCVVDDTLREMSVEEYELMGSWLDLRRRDGGWVCGVQDCDMHTAGGPPYAASEHPNGLHMAMPFDNADLLSVSATRPSPRVPALAFPAGPFSAPPRFHSLPRLPCQTFDIHSIQEAKLGTSKNAERWLPRYRELSMPGGWMDI